MFFLKICSLPPRRHFLSTFSISIECLERLEELMKRGDESVKL